MMMLMNNKIVETEYNIDTESEFYALREAYESGGMDAVDEKLAKGCEAFWFNFCIDVKDKELGDFFIDTRLTAFDNGKFTGKYSATEQEFPKPFKEATFALDCPAEQLVRLSDSELDDFITKVCDSVYDFGYDSEHLEIAARFNKENKLIDYKVTSEDEEGVSFLRQHNHWKTIQEIDR